MVELLSSFIRITNFRIIFGCRPFVEMKGVRQKLISYHSSSVTIARAQPVEKDVPKFINHQ